MEVIDTPTKQRPPLLSILCVLSFIGSGIGLLSNLVTLIMSPLTSFIDPSMFETAIEHIHDVHTKQFVELALEIGQKALHHVMEISIVKFILYATSLTGAILMFQLKKVGFYIYSAAQILLLFVAPVFLGFNLFVNVGILFGAVFAFLFIGLYAINLKKLN